MSFGAAAVAAGSYLLGETVKGIGAQQSAGDIAKAKEAAQGMYSTRLAQIQKGTTTALGNIKDMWQSGWNTLSGKAEQESKGVEGLQQKIGMQTGDIVDIQENIVSSFSDQMTALTEKRNYQEDVTKLTGEESKTQAEEKYEKILAELDMQPDTFMEGFMGGIFS